MPLESFPKFKTQLENPVMPSFISQENNTTASLMKTPAVNNLQTVQSMFWSSNIKDLQSSKKIRNLIHRQQKKPDMLIDD
jgi:hypothetical protein